MYKYICGILGSFALKIICRFINGGNYPESPWTIHLKWRFIYFQLHLKRGGILNRSSCCAIMVWNVSFFHLKASRREPVFKCFYLMHVLIHYGEIWKQWFLCAPTALFINDEKCNRHQGHWFDMYATYVEWSTLYVASLDKMSTEGIASWYFGAFIKNINGTVHPPKPFLATID